MAMKLLPKSQVQTAKAEELRQKNEEGLKLAKRVDNLREVAAAEEASLEAFRSKRVKKINDEITQKASERDTLAKEVIRLKNERKEALEPLTEAWEQVRKAEDIVKEREERVIEAEAGISERARALELDEKKYKRLIANAENKTEVANHYLSNANRDAEKANLTLQASQKVKGEALALKEKMERESRQRDLMATTRERDIENREKSQAEERKRLDGEWAKLNDRKALLDRTINRKKK